MSQSACPPDLAVELKNFHIFGSGISFSISPTIHNAGFAHYDLPYKYDIRESSNIDGVAELIMDKQFGGASITMPHKLQVHKFCTDQTETVRLIGAINTLIVKGAGDQRQIVGDNTDWSGLYRIIEEYTTRTGQRLNVGLVIGAGGASRASLYAMYKAGLRSIYLVNRTLTTAETVKEDFKEVFEIRVIKSLEELHEHPDVIVGTVPAETTSEDQFSTLFGSRGLCIDMSYKPRQTPLLSVAQRNEGWYTVTGVEVLLAQAYDQFYLWTGREPPREKMIEAVAQYERERAKAGTKAGML